MTAVGRAGITFFLGTIGVVIPGVGKAMAGIAGLHVGRVW